ncbi:hypothetical protein HGRIS_009279 [Hohenbuehelia grisea]|uniref:SH3 domain-containing protein n=1 Tax=Hohenbuehelia grisea TaxID=104357 RepID=A0ABR3J0M5_9AGAR
MHMRTCCLCMQVAASPEVSNAIGRVAAASFAFNRDSPSNSRGGPPPAPPRRNPSSGSPEPSAHTPPQVTPVRKFGDVDTSSAKNMFNSLRHSTANKSATPPPMVTPSAFPPKRNAFAPPPVRRVSSTADTHAGANSNGPPPPPPARHQPPPEPEPEEEEGEWAEAIYEYSSTDPGDLEIQAQERVLIIERTSEDWWTGELNGKRGLFPASYVKVL